MTDTVHALLIDATGKITDLQLSTHARTQDRQVHDVLGGEAAILGYGHHSNGTDTVAFAAEIREDLPPNPYAALALDLLTKGARIARDVHGPVLFASFTSDCRHTDVHRDAATLIRTVAPERPNTTAKTVRIEA